MEGVSQYINIEKLIFCDIIWEGYKVMKLKLYCSGIYPLVEKFRSTIDIGKINEGFEEVMYILWLLKHRGHEVEIVDVDSITEAELKKAYEEAMIPAIAKKCPIRRIFGSKVRSGYRFGKEVPALLVYEENNDKPTDIYPHIINRFFDYTTIDSYLRNFIGWKRRPSNLIQISFEDVIRLQQGATFDDLDIKIKPKNNKEG
jgi:hypothetical protein